MYDFSDVTKSNQAIRAIEKHSTLQNYAWWFTMTTEDTRIVDTVKTLLKNVEINSVKAEFNLETKQIRIELLAEFDNIQDAFVAEARSMEKILTERNDEKKTEIKNKKQGLSKDQDSVERKYDENQAKADKNPYGERPVDQISLKIDKAMPSGLTKEEKRMNLRKQEN